MPLETIDPLPADASAQIDLRPGDRGPFRLHGAARRLLASQEPEVLVAGAAGTGKSLACMVKLYHIVEQVPGVRALIVRKTRESLTESALVTWEEKVLPANHFSLRSGGQRRMRQAYHFANGSTVVVGGLDKASRIMSTEFDICFVQEVIELTEGEWEALTTRLRNGVLPYQQIMGDTNPDAPHHWIRQRAAAGRLQLLESRHEDNPTIWDRQAGAYTPAGAAYMAKLDSLTGVRLARLRHGRWVQAEGLVYDGWDRAVHLIDRFDVPESCPRYWCIDFGYTNAFSCGWWAEDEDGRLYCYREIYHTGRLVEDHAAQILKLSANEPRPRAIICDHDAEDRATLERHLGMRTTAAIKAVSPGIQAVAARLRVQPDGYARLFILRDSLVERDPSLVEGKKPTCGIDEVDGYVWDLSANRKRGEEPVKANDHFMDQMRYMVAYLDLKGRVGHAVAGGERLSPFDPLGQLPVRLPLQPMPGSGGVVGGPGGQARDGGKTGRPVAAGRMRSPAVNPLGPLVGGLP